MTELTDKYLTLKEAGEGLYKEKGSKFIAYAYPVYNEVQIKEHISQLKEKYYDARHYCFAWQIGVEVIHYRANDDGEPSGTAGKPIYGQIKSHNLTNVLIVVVRYFGGTKLGVPGLIRAYKEAAIDVINNSLIVEKTVNDVCQVDFDYLVMNDIMRIIKEEKLNLIKQDFNLTCTIQLSLRRSIVDYIINKMEKIDSVKCTKK